MNKEMLPIRILFYFLFLHSVNGQLQINLYLTNWVSNDENNNDLQHDCLHVLAPIVGISGPGQIISYCMSEWPSKWNIQENHFDQKFTFAQLSKQNVTSHQLYLWSAPMDVIDHYQFYLNQLANFEETLMGTQFFYNCTLPNFGPKCQYMLYDYEPHHSSLDEIVHDYYCWNRYAPTTLTCYTHLECNRGLPPSCLDWSEICDGKVDCLNDGLDEEHCWQLEIHECNENEYRCFNGQCIPVEFSEDYDPVFDCLDRSDEPYIEDPGEPQSNSNCPMPEPTFSYEDASCIQDRNKVPKSLTSSCVPQRRDLLLQALFSVKPKSISDECWTAFKCIINIPIQEDPLCQDLCSDGTCDEIVNMTCPDIFYASAVPILFGHLYFAYEKNNLKYGFYKAFMPSYFCYNDQLLYLPDDNETWLLYNNNTCRLYKKLIPDEDFSLFESIDTCIDFSNRILHMWISWIYNDSILFNKSTMYQCIGSHKCISKHRLYNIFQDCFHGDDESISMWDKNCSIKRNIRIYKCKTTNECIPFRFVLDGSCHCTKYNSRDCDDETPYNSKTKIEFSIICDNLTHLFPRIIDGQNYTDETECDQWQCNNIYTRCDGFWNCLNGADELNCDPLPSLNCPSNNHICLSVETKKLMCLPIEKANDGNVDCIGAADEPTICRAGEFTDPPLTFYCKTDSSLSCLPAQYLCDEIPTCKNKEDEQSCTSDEFKMYQEDKGICEKNNGLYGSDIANALCKVFYLNERYDPNSPTYKGQYFNLGEIQNPSKGNLTHMDSRIFAPPLINRAVQYYQQRCHRGLDLQVWLNKEKNLTTSVCLCPPSFYGDICQFQNQRVSVTVRFDPTSDSMLIPFNIIVSLVDDSEERIIHSYEQLTYMTKKYCSTKFHAYLLYSTRPKNQTKHYSIHIDIYEKDSLNYRGSFIKPLLFPFLPVHRLSFIFNIPRRGENVDSCSDHQCINGKCRRYFNDPNNTAFCQCNQGWSGRYCTIQHTCTCSSDSLCIGKLANNRSLCVCPLNKMGDRCLLNSTICQINQDNKCFNGGQCIPIDEYKTIDKQFICICGKGFTGGACHINQTKIIVSFNKDIIIPSAIRIHFIRAFPTWLTYRESTFKTISFGQNSTTIYWFYPFHVVFIEWAKNYYLTVVQKQYKLSAIIEKTLHSSDRCLNISELFNETIVNYHLIRRIKYYQIPCQTNTSPPLSCFYDDIHLCLCQDHDHQRVANCLEFDHNMNMNCSGTSGCQNGGECFQDNNLCPETTFCACPVCFYGTQCQLRTSGYSLSLDAILGYHIQPNINISRQPPAVLVSLILSVIITLAGLINGVLSLITFKDKKARDVGCGIYLLCSSINTLMMMIIFALKIWILVFSHMESIKNRSFLYVQCISFDFLLRFCLTMDQWLTTCVAIERAYITTKGINFDKKKIKLTAKLVVISLVLVTIGTAIHDPINRSLFDEVNDEEKRIWCIVSYSSTMYIVNLVISIFHIIVPFIINIISAIIIIRMNTRQRAAVQKKEPYKKVLNKQIKQHKNLLIAPYVSIILAIPRLIISFASGCMKSASQSWLFLLGYFISFIPPILTFILFVLPSTTYYGLFRKALSRYRNVVRRRS